ncbi:asparagine synthase (glutamine-hydrolyzing) [Shewanella sp. Shew256]|uniref:asparagine synthase (glutamine-hydrolyzing) n=1 Tax=Shewanella sp. Shew256 TaxID=1969376 RepID=UPI000B49E226|nr:asparagine synthase (glutamine-hydrolyzing) [Shewanella sp. Shew256]
MCGIVGFVTKEGIDAQRFEKQLDNALESISYRGPDDKGKYFQQNIAFGQVRLSILDLSSAGHQPMREKNLNNVITYNGEVYNFMEIRDELIQKGVKFESSTDTEVILKGYNIFGVDLFPKLNGMYAFAIYDSNKNKVIIVRDRFGIKPLHYRISSTAVYFASEIKSLVNLSEEELRLNTDVLPQWSYYGSVFGEDTFYQGIQKLLPGHYMEIDLSSLVTAIHSYWLPENIKPFTHKSAGSQEGIVRNVRVLLQKAVHQQLVSDVPVGVFLSGGIDSSAITAFASQKYGSKLKTYSVGFDFDKGVNELPKAKLVAEKFGTDHQELVISGYDLADTVQKLVEHHDSPFSDAANIPLLLLGEKVKGDVKVILQGDGGDEIFAGYKRYQTLATKNYWKPFLPFVQFANALTPTNASHFARKRYINALKSKDDATLMALLLTSEDRELNPCRIFSKSLQSKIANIDPFAEFVKCDSRFSDKDLVQKMLYTDTQLILPDIFLDKVDRSTMAASIEVRVPFLENDLTEYVMSLPSSIKVKRGQKKWLLKQALKGIVPDEILFGAKTGFGVPFHYWLKGALYELFNDFLSMLESQGSDFLDYKEIRTMMAEHKTGQRNHGFTLWKTLNLMIWLVKNEKITHETQ